MHPGQLSFVPVTFIEDRGGRALVRLPNGSKTSVQYNAVVPLPARGYFIPSQDLETVTAYCSESDWHATHGSWEIATNELIAHCHEAHDAIPLPQVDGPPSRPT